MEEEIASWAGGRHAGQPGGDCGASVPGASPVVCVYALELVGGCGGVCRSGGEGGVDAWSWYH